MKVDLSFDPDDPNDVGKVEAIVTALRARENTGRPENQTAPRTTEEQQLRKLLAKQTGRRLRQWAENTQADQHLSLVEIAQLYGLSSSQVVAMLAKLGSTQRVWQIRVLAKHPGNPVTYSMPAAVRELIRRIVAEQPSQNQTPVAQDQPEAADAGHAAGGDEEAA